MTTDEIKAQLDLGAVLMGYGKELKELSDMIRNDEKLGPGCVSSFKGKAGLLVATNARLIFVSKILFSSVVEEFNYEKISIVEFESGLLSSELILVFTGTKIKFPVNRKDHGKRISDFIKEQINKPKSNAVVNQTVNVAVDPMDQIAKLASLKEQGVITEEEFTVKKKQLLGL